MVLFELRNVLIYFSGVERLLKKSFSCSRVLGCWCRFCYGKHIDPDIEFWHHSCSLLGFAGQWTVILGCHMILLAVDLCFYESFNIILPGGVPVGVLMLRPTSYRPLVQVFYGKHIDPDIEFWHHSCSLLGFAGQWTVILGCHMILLAVDLCFYESFNIILPGGVPVGVLMLRPTSYRPLGLWMYQVGTIVFILIFAFGDLILSRLC